MTHEEITRHLNDIANLTHIEAAKIWLHGPPAHPYFKAELWRQFEARFDQLGGLTSEIHKATYDWYEIYTKTHGNPTFSYFLKIILLLLTLPHHANTAILEWDANTETNLAGYKVYTGPASRQYFTSTNSTTNTTFTVPTRPGKTFFAVTAFDTEGLESEYSNEVFWNQPPARPLNLRIKSTNALTQINLLQSHDLLTWTHTGFTFLDATTGVRFYTARTHQPPANYLTSPNPKSGKLKR